MYPDSLVLFAKGNELTDELILHFKDRTAAGYLNETTFTPTRQREVKVAA